MLVPVIISRARGSARSVSATGSAFRGMDSRIRSSRTIWPRWRAVARLRGRPVGATALEVWLGAIASGTRICHAGEGEQRGKTEVREPAMSWGRAEVWLYDGLLPSS
jgi:hypothetical protein